MPQIVNGTSVFCPPRCLVQKEPFCLFLDELNACSLEVQKAFYSLILERRIGEYHLPDGSIVIGAGNRMQDNAITRQLPSALINRMVHVELRPSSRVWLEWAAEMGFIRMFMTISVQGRIIYGGNRRKQRSRIHLHAAGTC